MRTAESQTALFARRFAVCAVLVLSVSSARAERLPLKAYTTADGLAHNTVNKIVRDSRGFLWFCTDEGLSRFDGYQFKNFGVDQGLPHRVVSDFLEARDGSIWLATNAGLVRFNPKGAAASQVVYMNQAAGNVAPMFSVVVPEDEDRNARVFTVLLQGHDGTIWCGTAKHLYRLQNNAGRFKLEPVDIGLGGPPKQVGVNDLVEDRSGSLWIASFVGLFRLRPDGRAEHYAREDAGLPDNNIHDLTEDHQGQLWAGTRLGGFFRFTPDRDRAHFVAESYSQQNGLLTNWIFQLYETSDRRFWIATNKGLVEFLPNETDPDQRFRSYTRRNGLSHQEVTALGEDSGGNLWMGTNAAGVMRLARNGFVTYGEQDGVVTVNEIFEDAKGTVCFRGSVLGDQRAGAFDGSRLNSDHGADTAFTRFGQFNNQHPEWFKPEFPFDFGWVSEKLTVQTRNGEWWVGSGAGLYRFPALDRFIGIKTARPLSVYTTKDGLAAQQLSRVFADSGGNVWVSAFGLARWDRATGSMHDLAGEPGLPPVSVDVVRSFAEDRAGNIWIGFGGGVVRYREGKFTFFTTRDGLPPGAIMSIYSDHAGRLWLASGRGGVIRIDDPAAEHPRFAAYTTAQGLSGNGIEVITEDLYGRIYAATGRGLDQLNPETGSIKHFATDDGLAHGNIIAAFRDHTGTLWLGTHGGLSRFVPAPESGSPPPPIMITGITAGGESQTISALGETAITLQELEPGRNQIQIDFVAVDFSPGDILHYQYKLEGSGAEWSAPTDQQTISYASLAAGRYRFLVRALNSEGVISSSPAAVRFTILRPVWQRWWFLSLSALALTALIYAAYRYRVARLLELERVRMRIATDLHDDIGAGLSRIAVLSEVARHESGGSPINERLSVIASASRELVDSMSDIVWVINPERDQLHDLTQRMRRFASDVFTSRNIDFTFHAPGDEGQLKVGADVRRQLFLIFKECVNNIVRHSGCTQAAIELSIADSSFVLSVRDNGHGFDPAQPNEGNGLVNMRERAHTMEGKFDVDSDPQRGTAVTFDRSAQGHRQRIQRPPAANDLRAGGTFSCARLFRRGHGNRDRIVSPPPMKVFPICSAASVWNLSAGANRPGRWAPAEPSSFERSQTS